MKKAILLVNVGTPDSPAIKDVRRYLSQFLGDPRVITIPWLWRKILVNLLIVPFRASKSAALYRQLWTDNGSPLRYYAFRLRDGLQALLGKQADVWVAMNYGYPKLSAVLEEIRNNDYSQLVVVPLFPQYASSTTGSITDAVMRCLGKWPVVPELKITGQFFDHPSFLEAWVNHITSYNLSGFDHIVFSFHGLPLSHIPEACRSFPDKCDCTMHSPCYSSACYSTAKQLALRLGLPKERYSITFQSRMSKHWLQPFTDQKLIALAECGISRVLVVSPSFVADCLETTVELGIEYKKVFFEHGGKEYVVVDSLNDFPQWISALRDIINDAQ